ncbi:hypothetical protein T459_09235 [Capsicum annuum]|uniref:Uncharacterized protein n=1 Tax=Capsicum annuum TaxID=4072 RepID=A0A2G2ZYS8_CAPAN|nr:hypothetical protein T459_09235 [Capsicum annuum]
MFDYAQHKWLVVQTCSLKISINWSENEQSYDMVYVLRKAKIVKAKLEALDKSDVANRKLSVAYAEDTVVDRARVNMTNKWIEAGQGTSL